MRPFSQKDFVTATDRQRLISASNNFSFFCKK